MKIDHVAMYVENLEREKQFFITYFHAKSNEKYYNPKTGLQTYFLSFADGSRLEIMTRPNLQRDRKTDESMGYIHLAFSVGSKEAVEGLTFRLEKDGYKVLSGPRTTGDGYYESCVADSEGNRIEIVE